jgi:hypothetical protein
MLRCRHACRIQTTVLLQLVIEYEHITYYIPWIMLLQCNWVVLLIDDVSIVRWIHDRVHTHTHIASHRRLYTVRMNVCPDQLLCVNFHFGSSILQRTKMEQFSNCSTLHKFSNLFFAVLCRSGLHVNLLQSLQAAASVMP